MERVNLEPVTDVCPKMAGQNLDCRCDKGYTCLARHGWDKRFGQDDQEFGSAAYKAVQDATGVDPVYAFAGLLSTGAGAHQAATSDSLIAKLVGSAGVVGGLALMLHPALKDAYFGHPIVCQTGFAPDSDAAVYAYLMERDERPAAQIAASAAAWINGTRLLRGVDPDPT